MTASDILEFGPVPPDHPAMMCNCCGELAHVPDMRTARIWPFAGVEESCDFIVCSSACETAFVSFPTLDHFIMMNIVSAAHDKNFVLKISYQIWRDQLNKHIQSN